MDSPIETRLRRLERGNRLMACALVVGSAVALAGFTRQDAPDTLRCDRLELVDAQGRTLASLGVDADGSTGLFVHDEAGGLRASRTHDAGQSALFLYDGEGATRIGLAQFAHGGGGLALHGPRPEGAAVLYYEDGEESAPDRR
ncbi:MAG: hypothetical protein ACYTG2_03895 [Planctomycetota bacterium]|jgi:hypothetical protein